MGTRTEMPSDKVLVKKFKRGAPEALLAIYQRHRDYLLSVAVAMVIYTAQRADDVVGINRVFHGPTDYVLAHGQAVVNAANDVKKGNPWTFE